MINQKLDALATHSFGTTKKPFSTHWKTFGFDDVPELMRKL